LIGNVIYAPGTCNDLSHAINLMHVTYSKHIVVKRFG